MPAVSTAPQKVYGNNDDARDLYWPIPATLTTTGLVICMLDRNIQIESMDVSCTTVGSGNPVTTRVGFKIAAEALGTAISAADFVAARKISATFDLHALVPDTLTSVAFDATPPTNNKIVAGCALCIVASAAATALVNGVLHIRYRVVN